MQKSPIQRTDSSWGHLQLLEERRVVWELSTHTSGGISNVRGFELQSHSPRGALLALKSPGTVSDRSAGSHTQLEPCGHWGASPRSTPSHASGRPPSKPPQTTTQPHRDQTSLPHPPLSQATLFAFQHSKQGPAPLEQYSLSIPPLTKEPHEWTRSSLPPGFAFQEEGQGTRPQATPPNQTGGTGFPEAGAKPVLTATAHA